jgi:hypothetical protein
MLERLRELTDRARGEATEEDNQPEAEFKGLRMLAAHMLVLASVDITLDSLGRARQRARPPYPHGSPGPSRSAVSTAVGWLPAVLAPLAAAAHVTHAVRPSAPTATATRVLNAAAIGAGVAGLVDSFADSRRSRALPSLSPLALASAGVLGLILEREERDVLEARRRLERRAELMDRFAPRRRAKLDRIVVHI